LEPEKRILAVNPELEKAIHGGESFADAGAATRYLPN
jgi:hypothetical protein